MADDNVQLVTIAQLIAANNWLSHDTEDFIDAARTITSQVIGPGVAEREAAQARIEAGLVELDRCAIGGYWSGTLVARIRAALTGEEEQ